MTRETLLMILRGDEAEPVLVETDEHRVTLTLDSGERLTFDRTELLAAILEPTGLIQEAA